MSEKDMTGFTPFLEAVAEAQGRSTPLRFHDQSHVRDKQGALWRYFEPADVWRLIDTDYPSTSSRSYQRLVAEFGPLVEESDGV